MEGQQNFFSLSWSETYLDAGIAFFDKFVIENEIIQSDSVKVDCIISLTYPVGSNTNWKFD